MFLGMGARSLLFASTVLIASGHLSVMTYFLYIMELMFVRIFVIHLMLISVEVLKDTPVRHSITVKNSKLVFFFLKLG